jgi:hypothetical protein
MKTLLQVLVGAVIGGLGGGLLGAAILGVRAYVDTAPGFLGSGRSWTLVAAGVGGVLGAVQGILIGLIVAATKSGKTNGALIGGAVGMVVYGFFLIVTTNLDPEVRLLAFFAIPGGAIVGVLGAEATATLRARQAKLPN